MRTAPTSRMPVLVVDDDEAIRRLLVRELSHQFDPIAATSLAEALSVLDEFGSSLAAIVTDRYLGYGSSGLDLLEAARNERLVCIRVMVSGEMDDDLQAQLAADELADAAFGKPWPPRAVAAVIEHSLARPARLSK